MTSDGSSAGSVRGVDPAAAEDEIDALENALVEYDEKGELFGTSGAGAYFLAKFLTDRGWRAASPLPEGRPDGPCQHCDHFRESHNFDENALRGLALGHCVADGCDCATYRPAPAVPVGVQPEPAEDAMTEETLQMIDYGTNATAPAVPVVHPEPDLPAGYSGADNRGGQVTDAAGANRPRRIALGVTGSPAGKSHPEPDRSSIWPSMRQVRWAQQFSGDAAEAWAALTPSQRGAVIDALAPRADVEVAAAVAAVRADTAAMVEVEARKWLANGKYPTTQSEAFFRLANRIAEGRS